MRYIEALDTWDDEGKGIFLAGGITDCPDWQADAVKLLEPLLAEDVAVINPRRENFPIHDPDSGPEQIAWEVDHLERAHIIMFWFADAPSVQPISLYELGRYAALGRTIIVGADPAYKRLIDVHEQLRHARPEIVVHGSLRGTCEAAAELMGRVIGRRPHVEVEPTYASVNAVADICEPWIDLWSGDEWGQGMQNLHGACHTSYGFDDEDCALFASKLFENLQTMKEWVDEEGHTYGFWEPDAVAETQAECRALRDYWSKGGNITSQPDAAKATLTQLPGWMFGDPGAGETAS